MKVQAKKSDTKGRIKIPGSKSHTIRAIYIASLAERQSIINQPLLSDDTLSAVNVCKAFGADIQTNEDKIIVTGFGKGPKTPDNIIDVGNSGTSLRIGLSTAALNDGLTEFTGDEQIRSRPLDSLISALNNLGAEVVSKNNNGKVPVTVKGKAKGGRTELEAVTSQYLTSLLINAPLFENDTEIIVTKLNEKPYIDITMQWLDNQNIKYENHNYEKFIIKGNQSYKPFKVTIPGDFSSASFFLALGALSEEEIILENLDMSDAQGDKRVVDILKEMGASVVIENNIIRIKGDGLQGRDIDMNATPDALPIMAVVGCFAEGVTKLLNVPQARLKETDRIKTMSAELSKMGADIEELEDGLIIKKSNLKAGEVSGYSDHRIVMALTIAGLKIEGETVIDTAESAKITFPNFFDLIKSCNGDVDFIN